MPVVEFGEYAPDISSHLSQYSDSISNVVPRSDGYGPFNALSAFTSAIGVSTSLSCRGLFFARKNDGSIKVFAGAANSLLTLDNTTGAWSDITKVDTASLLLADGLSFLLLADGVSHLDLTTGTGAGLYSSLSSTDQWQFAQFNRYIIAVQKNEVPQVFDLISGTAFTDLGGSPPQASYVSIVNRFVVLSGILAPNVYNIQWSDLNGITTWDGTGQSDTQTFADGGFVRGVAGGENGVIFQDGSIRRMTYAPGSPYTFSIDRVSDGDGLFAPYSLVGAGDRIFFCSPQGFKMMLPGGYPTPIGKEKIDRTFFADVDTSNLQLIIGASDPQTTRVYWAYKSVNGATGKFDTILIYDWALQKWTRIETNGDYIASLSRPGITLEGVDAAYGSNIDTITITSLDDISASSLVSIAGVDTNHKVGFFTGAALEATLETPELSGDGKRIFVRSIRPVSDAADIYGSVSARETEQATATYSTETAVNAVGVCPQRVSTRFSRGKLRIPAGTAWTYARGIEPDFIIEGDR